MALMEEDMLLGPADEEPHSDSDNDIIMPCGDDLAGSSSDVSAERRADLPWSGHFGAWLVGSPEVPGAGSCALGVADCRWEVTSGGDEADLSGARGGRGRGRKRARASNLWGRLAYTVHKVFMLENQVELPDTSREEQPMAASQIATEVGDTAFTGGSRTFVGVLGDINMTVVAAIFLPMSLVAALCDGVVDLFCRSIPLGMRLPSTGIVPECPPMALLAKLRCAAGGGRVSAPTFIGPLTKEEWQAKCDEIVLELPPGYDDNDEDDEASEEGDGASRKDDFDAERWLSGLEIVSMLRSSRFFTKVMNTAHQYDNPGAPPRDSSNDPSRSSWDRRGSELDVVDMLLQRRQFHADQVTDAVQSIHLYSDSSPVTGEELQGMVMDVVRKDGTYSRGVLPGASLCYGAFGAIAKTMALVWAVFLVAGPSEAGMAYFFEKVGSITTDGGTEIHIIESPNLLRAFLMWVSGASLLACAGLVDANARLLPNAMRISGWSHAWSHLMCDAAHVCPKWPVILDQLRCLVSFWRNITWRRWVQQALQGTDIDPRIFEHFRATLAKWRYETICIVMRELLIFRRVCQEHISIELFANAQDKTFIQKVVLACKDADLWTFIAATCDRIFGFCEGHRRWGMTCTCPHHMEERAKHAESIHIECFFNGRKLKQAWQHLVDARAAIKTLGGELTPADCEGHNDIWECVTTMLHKVYTGIIQRFKYLSLLPWILVNADTIVGAQEVMRQIRAVAWDHHDPFTRRWMTQFGGYVDQRAQGNDCAPELADAVKILQNANLEEGRGEGYNRGTSLEKKRAASSTSRHLKQSVRNKQCIARTRQFMARYGDRGARVLNFEIKNWKRILQVKKKNLWRKVLMPKKAAFARIYREDEKAREDFTLIAHREEPAISVLPDEIDGKEALRNEYLVVTTRVGTTYSVQTETSTMQPDGTAGKAKERIF